VVGRVVGAKHPNETVFYSAHWDHLGIGAPDASGDRIFNGAVDNGAGLSLLLELANAFGKGPKPDRSVVFMALTAEEQGLLGSEYYGQNPLYPLATTVADLNMDSPRPTGPARDFSASGDPPTSLRDELIGAGKVLGRTYTPDPRLAAGSFFRSDHFPFSKRGVPAFTFRSGDDLVEGGPAAGRAWLTAYDRDRYHQPGDNIDATWRSDGLAADARLMFELGRRLANSRLWPGWYEGSEFKAERDKTASARR
jgi:Zn-dependent M28 family amino/carboxypeptidase